MKMDWWRGRGEERNGVGVGVEREGKKEEEKKQREGMRDSIRQKRVKEEKGTRRK